MKSLTRHIPQLLTAILSAGALMLSSCGDRTDEPTIDDTTPRTVLVYMVSHNNLNTYSLTDIGEMQQAALAGHFGESRLLVYRHPYGGDPTLCEINPDASITELKTYDTERPSVSALRLAEVITDAKSIAPAGRYGLIFWGHGTGFVQDGITPLSYGGEKIDGKSYWMNVTDMADALGSGQFDWIYFDCCFMAGVEVAYELRHAADYIIASATELPAEGMPYQLTLQHLMPADSDLPAATKSTFDYFNNFTGVKRTCTMSLIRTDALDNLASAMRHVMTTTAGLPDGYHPQAFQTPADHASQGWSYYDLKDYAESLLPDYQGLGQAIDRAVTHCYATPKLWNLLPLTNHCGLSTLIIESADDSDLDRFNYRQLSWWTDVVSQRFKQSD